MSSINVGVDPTITDSSTVHLPAGLQSNDRPSRAVIWRHDGTSTKHVVRMSVSRDGATKAATGYGLFEALGGTLSPLTDLKCEYRQASAFDLLRYEPSARWDTLTRSLQRCPRRSDGVAHARQSGGHRHRHTMDSHRLGLRGRSPRHRPEAAQGAEGRGPVARTSPVRGCSRRQVRAPSEAAAPTFPSESTHPRTAGLRCAQLRGDRMG